MNSIKEPLMRAMEAYFGVDARRIDHARRVTEYAEALWQQDGGDYAVIIGASVLHDIGIHEAQKKYGSTAGKYQESEGPPIARQILSGLSFELSKIDEICEIIAHHHRPGVIDTGNFKILYDADWLVNLRDEYDIGDKDKLKHIIDKVFLTSGGKALAREIYLSIRDRGKEKEPE